MSVVFTNRGGRLKSWRLKQYLDAERQPLELVASDLGGSHPLPFSLRAPDAALTQSLNTALYSVSGAPEAGVQSSPSTVTFEYRDATEPLSIASVRDRQSRQGAGPTTDGQDSNHYW